MPLDGFFLISRVLYAVNCGFGSEADPAISKGGRQKGAKVREYLQELNMGMQD